MTKRGRKPTELELDEEPTEYQIDEEVDVFIRHNTRIMEPDLEYQNRWAE